ncbi:aconitase X swivel domain-containing protein [Microbacterium elymi]|uniref:DUF126 domain-containing protein n=1 Tax=Microbacterium elymi TaxID=2909587 RepID=A0ABY5NHL4_9MICO|nr:DUF126 domain-containing protein [Microbacterium elymi]UUT34596.1 DUF126 domain-containing protein [Microbacterium elymi]
MTVLRGRGIVGGVVEARALVTHDAISGFGGIDVATGTVIEPRHELFGVCFTGQVLVFPGAKGSSGWSGFFQSTRLMGTAPACARVHDDDHEGGARRDRDPSAGRGRRDAGSGSGDPHRRPGAGGRRRRHGHDP